MSRIALIVTCLVLASLAISGVCQANLLPNGGFEKDSNGDGVPDGWLGSPQNFSRQTLEEVQTYIKGFPSHADILKSYEVKDADGRVIAKREAGKEWPDYMKLDTHYRRFAAEYLPQNSRFGVLPVPDGLNLGGTTLAVRNLPPHEQVVSEPIPVKPDTGYRLSYWFRAYDQTTVMLQIIDGGAPRNETWPKDGVVSGISLGWAYQPDWTRYELPFRTGEHQTSIRLRPWMYFGGDDDRRLWYDDFKLVEDDSVVIGDIGDKVNPEPKWPEDVMRKGYAVVARPSIPATSSAFMPRLADLGQPARLTLSAGETGSCVVFARAMDKEISLRATPGSLVSDSGYGISNGYGARSVYLRAAEDTKLSIDFQRFLVRPEYLLHTDVLKVQANGSGQFWLTVDVPAGTPPGLYKGEVIVKPTAGGEETKLPIELTVPDIKLLEADVAFGTWYQTSPLGSGQGPTYVLPGSDEIFLADQRRHGMNTVGAYCTTERKGINGKPVVTLSELDAMVDCVKRAGLCREHPLLLLGWGATGIGGAFSAMAGGAPAVLDIYNHARKSGWPKMMFYVYDEPGGGREGLEETMAYYTPLRKKNRGLRTVTAGPTPDTQGHWYDVWIESMYISNWDEIHAKAKKTKSEVWMYDCGLTGRNPLLERFFAGLWTWRTGVRGNFVWSYGWFVRINDSGLPESKTAWEGRLAGVNDYRYLHTLESAIKTARRSGKGSHPTVISAQAFLDGLRKKVPMDTYAVRPQGSGIAVWNPVPDMAPEAYDAMRDECAKHIIAVRSRLK